MCSYKVWAHWAWAGVQPRWQDLGAAVKVDCLNMLKWFKCLKLRRLTTELIWVKSCFWVDRCWVLNWVSFGNSIPSGSVLCRVSSDLVKQLHCRVSCWLWISCYFGRTRSEDRLTLNIVKLLLILRNSLPLSQLYASCRCVKKLRNPSPPVVYEELRTVGQCWEFSHWSVFSQVYLWVFEQLTILYIRIQQSGW